MKQQLLQIRWQTQRKIPRGSALTKVGEVNSELETANQEIDALQANLETLSNEMTTSYAKKSDLTQDRAHRSGNPDRSECGTDQTQRQRK